MTPTAQDLFYSRLPVNEIPLSDLLMEEHLFYKLPGNWHIVITDIEKSTNAVDTGRHENVNLVATGSMVAVLNISHKAGITIPAFFGGDGATFIVPPSILPAAIQALEKHRDNATKTFDLSLRVGHLPVSQVYEEGYQLTISKLRTSASFVIPVVLGEGLAHAEKLIKHPGYTPSLIPDGNGELDLSGMQCRWDKVSPPQNEDEVISLLVVAREGINQPAIFKKVIDLLDRIYGNAEKRKPISVPRLRLNGTLRKLALEMRAKFGRYVPFYLAKAWMASLVAPLYFKTQKGKIYLDQLVAMSDTLIIDGKINTVISGTPMEREQLTAALDAMEKDNEIAYGLHVSKEAILSCYVQNLDNSHIHFVDGAQGGYTHAAIMLKKKLAINYSI